MHIYMHTHTHTPLDKDRGAERERQNWQRTTLRNSDREQLVKVTVYIYIYIWLQYHFKSIHIIMYKKIKNKKETRFFPCLAFAPSDLCTNLVVKYDTDCYQKLQSFWIMQRSAEEVWDCQHLPEQHQASKWPKWFTLHLLVNANRITEQAHIKLKWTLPLLLGFLFTEIPVTRNKFPKTDDGLWPCDDLWGHPVGGPHHGGSFGLFRWQLSAEPKVSCKHRHTQDS